MSINFREYKIEDSLWKYWYWLNEQVKKDPDFLKPLEGKDLACFCALGKRCHVDVLIKYIEMQKVIQQ